MHASPNAKNIFSGFNASSQNELEVGAKRNVEIISGILERYAVEIEENGLSGAQVADVVQRAATGAKDTAKSRTHLLDLRATLRVAVLRVTGAA